MINTRIDSDRSVAEFFAGIGLMRMGLERAGWTVVYANDIDPAKREMYSDHFGASDDHFALGDIHDIDPDTISSVTLATASFPCTDLSLAGSRSGLSGTQSSAFWGFVSILAGMGERRPPLIMLENVPGFVTSHGGKDFREALIALNELGYAVDPFIVDAAYFVPQSRQRLFVVGQLVSPGQWPRVVRSSAMAFYGNQVRPKLISDFIFMNPEIWWGLRDLPPIERIASSLSDILEDIPDDGPEWWSAKRADYLLSQMSDRHRATADERIGASAWSYGTVFRRIRKGKSTAELRTDGLAGCLRTPKGGSAKQILAKMGFGQFQARLLTARECARLMGADEYAIQVGLQQALFGFGDAVCVPVVTWIAENYLDCAANGVSKPERQDLTIERPLVANVQ